MNKYDFSDEIKRELRARKMQRLIICICDTVADIALRALIIIAVVLSAYAVFMWITEPSLLGHY